MEEGANHSPCEPIQGRRKRDRGLYRDHNGMIDVPCIYQPDFIVISGVWGSTSLECDFTHL